MSEADPLRVAILSRERKGSSTQRLRKAFAARGHEVDILNTMRLGLELFPGASWLSYRGQTLPPLDAVLPRIGISASFHGAAVLAQLELMGIYSPVTARALRASRDKLQALQIFETRSIPFPPSCFVCRRQDLDGAIQHLGDPPYIVKVLQGTQGSGVVLADDARQAVTVAEALLDAGRPVLLQRFIAESHGKDVRAVVVGDRVISAVRRENTTGEFRSNVHRGAEAAPIEIDPAFAVMAVRATHALGLEVAGVDMLESADGPVVMEVNSSPGIRGMEDATGDDIAGAIVRHVERRVAELPA